MNRGDLPSSDYGKASRREDIFVDDVDRQACRIVRKAQTSGSSGSRCAEQLIECEAAEAV
jgi:hypothetical protein